MFAPRKESVSYLFGCLSTDPNVQGDEERTPIFLAAKCNHPAIVEVLAGHPGIETDLPDMYGMLPAHVAARRGHLQVLEVSVLQSGHCLGCAAFKGYPAGA